MSYGYPAPPPGVQMPPRQSSNGLAIAGFVLCLISLAGSWIPILNLIPIGLAILGLILAGVGLAKSREVGNGRGLAIAGLVVGVLSIVVAVAVNVLTVYLIKDTVDEASRAIVVGPDGTTLTTSPEEPARLNSTISSAGFDTQITGVTSVESDVDGQVPTAGHVYLQVSLTSTNTGRASAYPSVEVAYVSTDGTEMPASTLLTPTNPYNELAKVRPRESASGNVLIEVPAQWLGGVLKVSPSALAEPVYLSLR